MHIFWWEIWDQTLNLMLTYFIRDKKKDIRFKSHPMFPMQKIIQIYSQSPLVYNLSLIISPLKNRKRGEDESSFPYRLV